MAAALDEIIDQSVQRMLNLSASSDQFLSILTQADTMIAELTEVVQTSRQEAQTSFDSFSTKLDEAENNLQTILQTTLENLNSLQSQVTQIDEKTESVSNEVKTQLDEFKGFADESVSSIQQQAETTQTELNELAQQVEGFQTELVSQQETTTSSLEEFRTAIDLAKQSFESKAESLTSQLETFEQDVASKLTALVTDVDGILEEGNTQLTSLQGLLESTSGDALSAVEDLFLQECLGELSGASAGLNQGISLLKETGVDKLDDFAGKFRDILGKVDKILDLIEEIKPVLDVVNDYL